MLTLLLHFGFEVAKRLMFWSDGRCDEPTIGIDNVYFNVLFATFGRVDSTQTTLCYAVDGEYDGLVYGRKCSNQSHLVCQGTTKHEGMDSLLLASTTNPPTKHEGNTHCCWRVQPIRLSTHILPGLCAPVCTLRSKKQYRSHSAWMPWTPKARHKQGCNRGKAEGVARRVAKRGGFSSPLTNT